jgi:hypothetical protein
MSRVSPSCSDRAECRVGPYFFFFFLVAFFLATASPPSIGVLEIPLLGMLVRRPKSVKSKIPYIGVAEAPAPQI